MGSLPQLFSSLVSFVLFDTYLILRLIELNNLLLATPPNSLPLPERVQSLVVQDALPEKERVGLGSIGSCFLVGRSRRIHRGESGRKGGEDFQLDRCGGHREGREGGRGGVRVGSQKEERRRRKKRGARHWDFAAGRASSWNGQFFAPALAERELSRGNNKVYLPTIQTLEA